MKVLHSQINNGKTQDPSIFASAVWYATKIVLDCSSTLIRKYGPIRVWTCVPWTTLAKSKFFLSGDKDGGENANETFKMN